MAKVALGKVVPDISAGTVQTGAAGTDAVVTITGTNTDKKVNFIIPKGDKGETGGTGATGATGPTGATGEAGFSPLAKVTAAENGALITITDVEGPTAVFVKNGEKGETGAIGPKGDTGAKGDKGDTGLQGPQGIQGEKGDKGETGSKGDTGPQGPQGIQGEQGIEGLKGETGAQGPIGPKGDTGKGLDIRGYFPTTDALFAADPDHNYMYGVGAAAPYDIWDWDSLSGLWVNNGKLQGAAGKSAYQIAVDAGFVGTESEWLASLKGKNGVDGTNGLDGAPGKDGINGVDGAPGKDGTDGFSPLASVQAVTGGATISITDKNGTTEVTVKDGKNGLDGADGADGAPGTPGTPGTNGADGQPGKDGTDGKSAYTIAVEGGYLGTLEEFTASLNRIPTAEQQAAWTAKETTAGAQAKADAALNAAKAASVPTGRKVNNKALTGDIALTAADVGARPSTWTPTAAEVGAVKNSSVSDIQIVASFPASPTSGVLYIVLEA